MEALFANDYFLIFYGLIFYYVILWGSARNKKSKAKKARLAVSDSRAERDLVENDPEYEFNFKEWLHDNKDEIIVAGMFSFLLIGFDQLAIDLINRKWFANDPIDIGKAVFLLGGILGDLLYRTYDKIRG